MLFRRRSRIRQGATFARSNDTFWSWQLNHIGQVYGAMDVVFHFAATLKEYPPRAFPPSFVPTTIMEETRDDLRAAQKQAQQKAK